MKFAVMGIVLIVAGFLAFKQMRAESEPPPPPETAAPQPPPEPPPPPEPASVISEEEQRKIIKSANDHDPNVRWEALVLLDKMKAPLAYPVLFEKLHKDVDPSVRIRVAGLLAAKRGNPEVAQNLIWAAKDYEPDVRLAALQALEQYGDPNTASAVTDSLKDHEDRIRIQALKTINTLQEIRTRQIEEERRRQEELQRQAAEAERLAAKKRKKRWF